MAPELSTMTPLDTALTKMPEGMILPPRNLREVIEKTAGYVVRSGPSFLQRLRERNGHESKFSFIRESDAYHEYYCWRLSEIEAGRTTDVAAGQVGQVAMEPDKPKGPVQPPDYKFSSRMPNLNAKDLDILKLAARHCAGKGRPWLTALSQRESGNPQFDFLRPQHSLHQYFTRLTTQYLDLLNADTQDDGKLGKEVDAQVELNTSAQQPILEKAKERAEYVKYTALQKQQEEEKAEQEQVEFAQIDWHDFSIVDTLIFTEEDALLELDAPTTVNALQNASLEQRAMMSLNPATRRIEEAAPDEDFYVQRVTPVQMVPPPPVWTPAPPAPEPMQYRSQAQQAQDEEEARRIRERAEERDRAAQAQAAAKGIGGPMRIRSDYTPRGQAKKQAGAMGLCPNCNQQIPYSELEEHMRSKCSYPPKIP